MINLKDAVVKEIISSSKDIAELKVEVDQQLKKAINYNRLTGPIDVDDKVLVNMTAVDLDLGSGGYGFVCSNLTRQEFSETGPGHIMKLRYTPYQHSCLSVEEEASPHHETLERTDAIDGLPVIACGLHSQLLPIAATIRKLKPNTKVAYIMTDGGALPAAFSRTVAWLKQTDYIAATITAGQAFGGDLEAVNIYSALAAAKAVVKADIAVVAMGPGIVGTGTLLGHSGIEQTQIINAAASLKGRPIAVLRISQKDVRGRHQGISHHTLSALSLSLAPAIIPVPELTGELSNIAEVVAGQIENNHLADRHEIQTIDSAPTLSELRRINEEGGPTAKTMGRGVSEEPAFFLAAGAAAHSALDLAKEGQ